jgi:hypothetical protein
MNVITTEVGRPTPWAARGAPADEGPGPPPRTGARFHIERRRCLTRETYAARRPSVSSIRCAAIQTSIGSGRIRRGEGKKRKEGERREKNENNHADVEAPPRRGSGTPSDPTTRRRQEYTPSQTEPPPRVPAEEERRRSASRDTLPRWRTKYERHPEARPRNRVKVEAARSRPPRSDRVRLREELPRGCAGRPAAAAAPASPTRTRAIEMPTPSAIHCRPGRPGRRRCSASGRQRERRGRAPRRRGGSDGRSRPREPRRKGGTGRVRAVATRAAGAEHCEQGAPRAAAAARHSPRRGRRAAARAGSPHPEGEQHLRSRPRKRDLPARAGRAGCTAPAKACVPALHDQPADARPSPGNPM